MSTEEQVKESLISYLYTYANIIEEVDKDTFLSQISIRYDKMLNFTLTYWGHSSVEPDISDLTNLTPTQVKCHNYYSLRSVNYPSVKEQLDMMWHNINEETNSVFDNLKSSSWFTSIKNVKDEYPKP